MTKINLHISHLSPVSPAALALVRNDKYRLSFQDRMAANEAELADKIRDADAVYIGGDDYYSAKVLESAKNLKLLSFGGTGFGNFIDAKAATELGIAITNTPGANSQSVAEMAVGLALDALRKITFANCTNEKPDARELRNIKIGLIGYGNINRRVMKILQGGFGADVRYWNRTPTADSADLDTILRTSDMIFIAITANDETKGFIGAAEFSKMKDGAILVNPAHESLIDGVAAMHALESGKIAALAMDGELDADSPLRKFGADRLIATPHIAARTSDAWNNTDMMAFRNIVDFFETGTSGYIVNPNRKTPAPAGRK